MSRNTIANVWRIMSLRCDEASQLISASQDRQLGGVERWALSFHLLICRACRTYRRQLAFLRRLLRAVARPSSYEAAGHGIMQSGQSEAMKKRISARLQGEGDSP